jgi:PEP-CTERM motif
LSIASPVLTLGTCKIDELSPEHYQVVWNTGEMLDVTNTGSYLDLSSELSWIDGLGSMEGLLSSDLSPDLWRVTAATSLLDPVPEPGTLILLATGLVAFGAMRRRATFPKPRRSTSCGFDDASSLGNVHAK